MSTLSAQERAEKNFRERVYYYKNKHGLTYEQAIEKARNARPKKTRTNLNLVPPIQVPESRSETPEIQESESRKPEPESRKPEPENQIIQEPSDAEIRAEVDRLKRIGVMTEITCSSDTKNIQNPEPENVQDSGLELGICVLVALATAGILMKNTAEIWNYSLEGFAKAAILELGTCGFSIYRPADQVMNVLCKFTAAALIALSLCTQYSGVAKFESSNVSVVETSEEQLDLLRSTVTRAEATHDAAKQWQKPETLKVLKDATDNLNAALEKKKTDPAKLVSVSSLKLAGWVELLFRVAYTAIYIGSAARIRQLLRQSALRTPRVKPAAAK